MAQKVQGPPAINILPPEYRRAYLTRAERMLLLVLAAAVVVVAFSFQTYRGERQEVARLQAEEQRLTTQVQELQPQINEAEQLRQEIATLKQELGQLQQVEAVIGSERLDWDALLTDLLVATPPGIRLAGVTKEGRVLTVVGTSSGGFGALVQYVRQLDANDDLAEVIIDSTQTRTVANEGSGAGPQEVIDFSLSLLLAQE